MNDQNLIFEAYKKMKQPEVISENVPPTEAGESFGDVVPHEKIPGDVTKYMKQIPQEHRGKAGFVIIKKIKDFLTSQANKVFPGDYKAFRNAIAEVIHKEFPSVDKANCLYSARKIQELLVDKQILKDERGGKIRVSKAAAMVSPDDIEAKFKEAAAELGGEAESSETSASQKPPTKNKKI